MTARELYRALLVELNEVKSSVILLEEFNYFVNKGIQNYINKRYNYYEYNQQLTDDLRFLHSSIIYTGSELYVEKSGLYGNVCKIEMPNDYYHLLSCACRFKDTSGAMTCEEEEDGIYSPCYKMTSDNINNVITNYYLRPSYKRPYYFFNTEVKGVKDVLSDEKEIDLTNGLVIGGNRDNRQRQKEQYKRYGNTTKVAMDIILGKLDKSKSLDGIYINYLRSPQYVELKQRELDLVEDTSQLLEFPDYVAYEIINTAIPLLLVQQDSSDKVQMTIGVNKSIVDGMPGTGHNG